MSSGRRARMEAPDPNTLPIPPYATYIDNRHPVFKTHPNLGQAKAAITTHTFDMYNDYTAVANGFVYKYVPGKGWQLLNEVHPGDLRANNVLWHTYMIPEYEDPIDWQKKIKNSRSRREG